MAEVIPRVERAVRADPARRGFGGSSLAGLLALRAGQRYPETFPRVLAESPSLNVRGDRFDRQLFSDIREWSPRTWIAVGTLEAGATEDRREASAGFAGAVTELAAAIDAAAAPGDLKLAVVEGAVHNEDAWAERFDDALLHLYPASGD